MLAVTVEGLLAALSDPVRLEMVRRLAGAGDDLPCGTMYENVAKSTASYHFARLLESGLLEQYMVGTKKMNHLRLAEVEAAVPGLLSSVLAAPRPAH